ncbi:MAG: DNA polymerase/3'-5' exonuclease PolX [Candidatus Caldarchaeum sp.]
MTKNIEVADILDKIGDTLEVLEENPFKVRAYRNAARNIRDLAENIEDIAARGKLTEIQGVGADIATKIMQYLTTGQIEEYERLKKKVPESCIELLGIQGLGPKTLALLYRELGVKNLADLEKALEGEEILRLPRMGAKKVEDIKRGVKQYKERSERIPLGIALPIAEDIVEAIEDIPGVSKIAIAGSIRRRKETIKDIDILTVSEDGARVIKRFTTLPFVKDVLLAGDTKASIITKNGIQVDLRVVDGDSWGGALQYFTGSMAHNVKLRTIAIKKGYNLSEYGIFRGDEKVTGASEEGIYACLGLEWIPPELREDRGEIEAALKGTLPKLVTMEDIRGDLHCHSNWSDGRDSVEEMASAAKNMGYEYVAITDHSVSATIAKGLTVERLCELRKEVEAAREKIKGISILLGAEVDIKGDGTLDFPDDVLKGLDIVLVAIHSGFKSEMEAMTKRVVKALQNPYVHALVHPTGRLIGQREPYEIDMDEVMKTAKKYGKALEVNAHYLRLDLNEINIKKAIGMGIKIVISTDSHSTDQLRMMRYGVDTARRGWARREDVVNTMSYGELKRWLSSVRNGAIHA